LIQLPFIPFCIGELIVNDLAVHHADHDVALTTWNNSILFAIR
jgi:hypothetical protein